jgi:hypothetical protein
MQGLWPTPRLDDLSRRARDEIRKELQIAVKDTVESLFRFFNQNARLAADERLEFAKIYSQERMETAQRLSNRQHYCRCRLS